MIIYERNDWQNQRLARTHFNPSAPKQNGRHFADDIFKCNVYNENLCILVKTELQFVHRDSVHKKSALV